MRFATGLPEQYVVPHLAAGESVVAMSISPEGSVLCILTQLQVQFWSALQHITFLVSFALPKCSLLPGMDVGSRLLWHPKGRSVAVTTIDRRIVIYEADIVLSNETAVQLSPSHSEVVVTDARSRVCIAMELKLDSGIITSIATSTTCLLVCTSGGFVVVLHWTTGKKLHVWSTTTLLQQVRTTSASAVVGGSVAFFAHSVLLKKSCLILSDGSLCLLDCMSGNDFTQENVSFSGVCHAGIGATSVSFNGKHNLVAVACTDSSVRFYSIEGNELRRHDAQASARWCEDTRLLEGVVAMRWSGDEETIAVGFRKRGIAVLHHSGACIMSSFTRYDWSTTSGRSVHRPLFPSGCQCLAWDQEGHRLFGTEPEQKSFTASRFGRLARTMDPAENAKSSICLFEADSISFFHASDSDGIAENWETVRLPTDYSKENFPIRFCSVTGDGQHAAVSGTNGCALYNRKLRRWKLFGVRSQEKAIVAVACPCWVQNTCLALPVRNITRREFEVRVYSRFHLDESAVLCVLPMQRRPQIVSCHMRTLADHKCVLAVVDSANSLQLHELEVFTDSVTNPKAVRLNHRPLRVLALSPPMHSPLALIVCPLRREAAMRPHSSKLPQLLVLQRNHELVLLDPNEASTAQEEGGMFPFAAAPVTTDRVHSCWLDLSVTYAVQECCVVIAFGNEGVHAHSLPAALVESPTQKSSRRSSRPAFFDPSVTTASTSSTHLAEFDVEALPIGVLPLDGFIVFAMEGLFRKFVVPGLYPSYQVNCRPVLYQHRLLLPLVSSQSSSSGEMDVAVVDDPLARVLHRLRETGSFVDTMDYLLHSIIDNELDSRHVAHDRRRALQFIISILRKYPEFHQIIVGCVRKIDVVKWRVVFDVIGKPMDFFNDCIANRRIIEAAHVVRVVMMDDASSQEGIQQPSSSVAVATSAGPTTAVAAGHHGTPLRRSESGGSGGGAGAGGGGGESHMLAPLEDATNCARRLFTIVLGRGDFILAFELLRFMTLLSLEIDLPNNDKSNTALSAIERALRSMWRGPQKPNSSQSTASSLNLRSVTSSVTCADAGLLRPCETSAEHSVGNMLRKYPSLRTDMESTVLSLLRIGKVAQLCAMFESFQLDLDHFISTIFASPSVGWRYSSFNAVGSSSSQPTMDGFADNPHTAMSQMSLREIFSNLHAEFGLPRCPQGEIPIPPSLASHPLAMNSLRIFTATQEHLATVTASCTALNNIAVLFCRHTCVEYQCAFSILLLQEENLKRLLSDHGDAVLEQVTELLCEKENAGYRRMLEACCRREAI